jgi:hypothetical protein
LEQKFLGQEENNNSKRFLTYKRVRLRKVWTGFVGSVGINYFRQKITGFTCALKKIEKKLLKEEDIVDQFIR